MQQYFTLQELDITVNTFEHPTIDNIDLLWAYRVDMFNTLFYLIIVVSQPSK